LHRVWVCHTCNLEQACHGFYKHNDIDICDANDLSLDRFIDEYEMKNKPVIIKNAINHWPSMGKWNTGYLSRACGEKKFRATSATAPVAATFTMEEYFAYAAQTHEEAPLYLFDRDFHAVAGLGADYDVPVYFNPRTAVRSGLGGGNSSSSSSGSGSGSGSSNSGSGGEDHASTDGSTTTAHSCDDGNGNGNGNGSGSGSGSGNGNKNGSKNTHSNNSNSNDSESSSSESSHTFATDLFRVFGDARPDYRWLIAGPKRSGSIFHIDPNNTNAWNVCIKGRKKWIFYPPSVSPPGVVSSPDGADVTVPLSTGEWLLSFWPAHLEARKHADPKRRPIEAIVEEGEVIFVPHGYWHMVVNLEDCIAVTHNYVSSSNLPNVLRFLRDKPDQISGVRDRAELGAVQPDALYKEFVGKLSSVLSAGAVASAVVESNRKSSLMPRRPAYSAYHTSVYGGQGVGEEGGGTCALASGGGGGSSGDADGGLNAATAESQPAFSFSFF
jgi:hypothetical protein